jgi:hypothetical protein
LRPRLLTTLANTASSTPITQPAENAMTVRRYAGCASQRRFTQCDWGTEPRGLLRQQPPTATEERAAAMDAS